VASLCMDRALVQALLDDFGRIIGLDGLELDTTGRAALAVDDSFTLDIEYEEGGEMLLLSTEIDALGTAPEPARLVEMLHANLLFDDTAGSTLALSGAENKIVLQRALPLPSADLDAGHLMRIVESFLDVAEEWRRRLRHPEAQPPDQESSPQEPPLSSDALRI
jgi:Tir chaperone protein (CesT) family